MPSPEFEVLKECALAPIGQYHQSAYPRSAGVGGYDASQRKG